MTGKELIKWIQENNAEDLPIEIQYQDGGGCYYGTEKQYVNPTIIDANEQTRYSGCESYKRIVI